MKIWGFCIIILLSNSLWASDRELPRTKVVRGFDPRTDIISDDLQAGPYLIYDCSKKSWICVLKEHFDECAKKREEDESLQKTYARCAPISEYEVKFACFQEQLRLVTNVDSEKLCVLDSWKQHEINLRRSSRDRLKQAPQDNHIFE